MLWTQGQHKILKVAFRFWRSNQTIRKEHRSETNVPDVIGTKRWKNTLQRYQTIPNFSRLRLEVNFTDPVTNIFMYTVAIQDKGKQEMNGQIVCHMESINTAIACFQKCNLNDEKKLVLDLGFVCLDTANIETVGININPSVKSEEIPFKIGTIDVTAYTDIDHECDVSFRDVNELCTKEKEFVTKRKQIVLDNINNQLLLNSTFEMKDAPNIAVIGSGGGMRAVIGMSAAMTALQLNGILDYTMYTAGVSGSAWYITTLYADDDKEYDPIWTHNSIRQRVCVRLIDIAKWRFNAWKTTLKSKKISNMTRKFGQTIGSLLLQEKCDKLWSEQANRLENGTFPLPLLSALHIRDEISIKAYSEWIELSPYEVLIPKYGAAIDMQKFGDKFYGGFVIQKNREQPISFLQGLCGSAYAEVRDYKVSDGYWLLGWSRLRNWIRSVSKRFGYDFTAKVPNWLRGMTHVQQLVNDIDSKYDNIDVLKPEMVLVDAGIAFNSPYPTIMRPAREIDIIISFDFSDRGTDKDWPFGELEKAVKWANERRIPFPEVAPQLKIIKEKCFDSGDYDEMYVFPGDDKAPTIVHFVMINKSYRFSGDATSQAFRILPDYSTKKFLYSTTQFDNLSSLIMHNVAENKEEILNCIRSFNKQ